jgi:hypothetical protein
MSLDIDRPINRAVVVGCAVSGSRNYLKLHMSRTLKVLLWNTHAETRKLWKRSAGLPPIEAILLASCFRLGREPLTASGFM